MNEMNRHSERGRYERDERDDRQGQRGQGRERSSSERSRFEGRESWRSGAEDEERSGRRAGARRDEDERGWQRDGGREGYGYDRDDDFGDDRGRFFRDRDERSGGQFSGGYEPFPYGAGMRGFGEDERGSRDGEREGRGRRRGGDSGRRELGGGQGRDGESSASYGFGRPGATLYQVEAWTITGPHTGRGPKGYRRSDEQLIEQVCQRLERHGDIDASEIEVKCKDGVVTLEGKVDDRQTKRNAEDCAEEVYGVKDVMNHLQVDRGFFERLFGGGSDGSERSGKARERSARGTGSGAGAEH